MRIDYQQFMSHKRVTALTLRAVAVDRLGLQTFVDWLAIISAV
jgi:hypothetical protein